MPTAASQFEMLSKAQASAFSSVKTQMSTLEQKLAVHSVADLMMNNGITTHVRVDCPPKDKAAGDLAIVIYEQHLTGMDGPNRWSTPQDLESVHFSLSRGVDRLFERNYIGGALKKIVNPAVLDPFKVDDINQFAYTTLMQHVGPAVASQMLAVLETQKGREATAATAASTRQRSTHKRHGQKGGVGTSPT